MGTLGKDALDNRYDRIRKAVISAVETFLNNNKSQKDSFAIFNPGNGLLNRYNSAFNWEIYTKVNDKYEPIDSSYDKKEAAAAMSSMPKFGIVASNAYLEAFIHKLLNDAFDALYADFTRHELEAFSWPDKLPFLKDDAQLLLPKNLPAEGKLEKLSAKLFAHKDAQLKALLQPNWSGNLESKLAEFFVAAVNGKELMKKLLEQTGHDTSVWQLQFEEFEEFEDSARSCHRRRHKYLVAPRDVQTLASMSNFFYGVRCLIAHGDATKTTSFGALKSEEPTCNYWIKGVTYYHEDTADKLWTEDRRRSYYISIEVTRKFGFSNEKTVRKVKMNKHGAIHETRENSVGKKPNGELIMEKKYQGKLESFDSFLGTKDESGALENLKKHCFDIWQKAKRNQLVVDYHLFLSLANFNVYYVRKIALVCLWICHTVIYGGSGATPDNFPSTVTTIEAEFERILKSTLV